MKTWLDRYCRLLERLLIVLLSLMVVLVFGNVVMRYVFNSSILVSEEVSRWLFVWLTFLGAVVALRRRGHLGTDLLVSRVGPAAKKVLGLAAHALMLWVSWLLLVGGWEQTRLNATVAAPVTGAPMAIVYASGVVFAVSALLMLGHDVVQLLRGQATIPERAPMLGEPAEGGSYPTASDNDPSKANRP